MVILRKLIAMILAMFQTLFIGIGIKKPATYTAEISPVRTVNEKFTVPDTSETNLSSTVEYASTVRNSVQCVYSDAQRTSYIITNNDIVFTHTLKDVEKYATLTDGSGNVYFENTFKSFYTDKLGVKHFFEESFNDARVNTVRLGEYYYDCHVRDMNSGTFKVDKEYHVYGDRLYMQYGLLADKAKAVPSSFGSEITVKADRVNEVRIRDANGIHTDIGSADAKTVEYAAFDIEGSGIAGFIVPSDGSTASLSVTLKNGVYTVTQLADLSSYDGINKYDETGGYDNYRIDFGFRVYTDNTHDFSGIDRQAEDERNPLDVQMTGNNCQAENVYYDALRGTYTVRLAGVGFNEAYQNPDVQYFVKFNAKGGNTDRNIYIRTYSYNSGCLECSALLDENGLLMPVDVEVCKNFMGDGGDSEYSYYDYEYGDSFTPITVEKNTDTSFTVLNLYQNWGRFPLKQLSSIEFHISYYHLSTGTTESNCIAPYFVFDRDGWTLPDFRNASGNMWSTQPQFNSVGILKFMTYRDSAVKEAVKSEFSGSRIDSCGPTYAEVTDYYTADNGCYTYSLTHTEFPQTDENRTYYTLKVDFNDTVSFDNFRRDFDIFYFDGRFVAFNKTGYLSENNEPVNADVSSKTTYHTLGSENPYFGFYSVTDETSYRIDECFGCNFAFIVKNSSIVIGGEKSDIPFVFRENGSSSTTVGSISLDAEELTFNKGDSIEMEIILLPWGIGTEDNDSNVLAVREDSAVKPLGVVENGEKTVDGYIPVIKAENNEAEFTLKGGRGNNVVRVEGFTSMKKPTVSVMKDGAWEAYGLSSSNGYDGYMIHADENGYAFSFVYNAEDPDTEYTFRISQ